MAFTFKLSKRLALIFAAAIGSSIVGCTVDVPSSWSSTPLVPLDAVGDTLFADGFESGSLTWDDNYLTQAKTVVAGAARTGSRGLRVTYAPGADGGALSKFITRGDRVFFRAAVRFPTSWTGDTRLLLVRAATAASPWGSFGVGGQCPSGANWAVTNLVTTAPNLDLRFYSYFLGMRTEANGQCFGRFGVAGDGGVAIYTAPLTVSKGAWHVVELEVQMNTVGQANGWQKMWLDDTLRGEWNNLTFRSSSLVQWNAVTLELSSGTITQTQTLDIDDVLVLAERPVVLPPPPPPAAAETLFTDGFESGTLTLWDDNVNAAAHAVTSAAALSGARGLRATYQGGSDAGSLSKFVTRRDRVYARAAIRFPANWTGDTKLLLLRAAPAATPWGSFGVAGQCPTGTNWAVTNAATSVPNLDLRFYTYFVGMRTEPNGQCWGRYGVAGDGGVATYTAPLAVSKGGWHVVELEAHMNTVGQADGWQKLWLDGALKGEWNGLTFRTSSALQWNAVTLELSSGAITQTQVLDIDDVVVLGSKPGSVAPPPPPPPPPSPTLTQVILTPDTAIVQTGATRQFTATGRQTDGTTIPVSAAFSATGGTVSGSGLYTAGATVGTFRVIASAGGRADTSTVTIRQNPVATVQIVPASASLTVTGTIQLQATLRDAAGQVLSGRPVSWSTSNALIASINGTGRVTGLVVGTATITATSEGRSGTSTITVTVLPTPPPPAPPPPAPGPSEPIYDASRNVSLFYDGFESYATVNSLTALGGGAYRYATAWTGLTGIRLITGGASEGNKKVQFDFQGTGEVTRILESYAVAPANSNVVVVTWLQRQNGSTPYNGKTFIVFPGSKPRFLMHTSTSKPYPGAEDGVSAANNLAKCYWQDGDPFRALSPDTPNGYDMVPTWNRDDTSLPGGIGYSYKQNRGATAFNYRQRMVDGQWHRFTTRFTTGSVAGRGRLEMWADGVKILEYLGDDASRCEYGKVYVPTAPTGFQWPGPSAFNWSGGASVEFDAIRFWR